MLNPLNFLVKDGKIVYWREGNVNSRVMVSP